MLTISDAWRGRAYDRDHVIWRDHREMLVGVARVVWDDTPQLHLDFRVEELAYEEAARGTITFPIKLKGGLQHKRAFADCPACGRSCGVLIFSESWKCGTCANLPNRSAWMTKEVRWTEELAHIDAPNEALDRSLGAKLARRRNWLLDKLGERRLLANSLFKHRLTAQWVTAAKAAEATSQPASL